MAEQGGLTEALASVQAKLPKITKDNTAKIETAKAKYSYTYADLASISATVLPMLGAAGLAWITMPALDASGRFLLAYQLRHTSGEIVEGTYPLPDPMRSTPQEVGSAITYARRYCLCSVTGVAPEDDDDDAAAASTVKPAQSRPAAQRKPAERPERTPPSERPLTIPTAPIGWTKLLARVDLSAVLAEFDYDAEVTAAVTAERAGLAVKALTGAKQHDLFDFIAGQLATSEPSSD